MCVFQECQKNSDKYKKFRLTELLTVPIQRILKYHLLLDVSLLVGFVAPTDQFNIVCVCVCAADMGTEILARSAIILPSTNSVSVRSNYCRMNKLSHICHRG